VAVTHALGAENLIQEMDIITLEAVVRWLLTDGRNMIINVQPSAAKKLGRTVDIKQ
jgi:hypothetical protein